MAIVNATVTVGNSEVDVPFQVQPLGDQPLRGIQPAQQPAANIAGINIDSATLTTIITIMTGAIGGLYFKNKKDTEKEDKRDNVIADTSLKQVKSLQETDKADYIFRAAVADYIIDPTDETKKQRLKELAEESKENYKAYYENIQPQPLDYDKDPVVKKLSAVQKRTTPQ